MLLIRLWRRLVVAVNRDGGLAEGFGGVGETAILDCLLDNSHSDVWRSCGSFWKSSVCLQGYLTSLLCWIGWWSIELMWTTDLMEVELVNMFGWCLMRVLVLTFHY